jgi:hypothetical protein
VALIQTPHRFRSKRQLWAYSGLALETRISAEYRLVEGQVRRSKKRLSIRGLNKDRNHDLKGLFKGAATMASVRPGSFQDFYQAAPAKFGFDIAPTTSGVAGSRMCRRSTGNSSSRSPPGHRERGSNMPDTAPGHRGRDRQKIPRIKAKEAEQIYTRCDHLEERQAIRLGLYKTLVSTSA